LCDLDDVRCQYFLANLTSYDSLVSFTFQCGVLCNRRFIVVEVLTRWLFDVLSVKLLGSDKSGHSKHRPTVKNTDHGD